MPRAPHAPRPKTRRRRHHHHDEAFELFVVGALERLMASVADLTTAVGTLQTTADAILAKLQAVPPPVATQADLDALAGGIGNVQNTLNQIQALP